MQYAGDRMPKTVSEAVDHMIAALGHEEEELIKNADEADLGEFHFGLGTGIREAFQLWHGNKELLESCGSETIHPDEASIVIIEALWRRLQTRH
jgi:hypothetical protein